MTAGFQQLTQNSKKAFYENKTIFHILSTHLKPKERGELCDAFEDFIDKEIPKVIYAAIHLIISPFPPTKGKQ